ncbi:Zinc finger, RING-type [Dillenia turbinata]|uniref:RING-type E3 ubiquitin transferase n=1 Tax=Dillenia turbinata TaxID=194707 RepID=A0AAN8VYC5_9MAGN
MGNNHTSAVQSASCSICNEDVKLQTEATEMPCKHLFHTACLLPRLKQTNTCPVCHSQLPSQAPSSSSSSNTIGSSGSIPAERASVDLPGSSTTPPIHDRHSNVILRPQLPYDMDPDLAPPPVTLPTSYRRQIDDLNYLCDTFGYGSHRPE